MWPFTRKKDKKTKVAEVEQQEPEVNRRISRKLKTLRLFSRLHLSPVLYQRLLDSGVYKRVRGWWRK